MRKKHLLFLAGIFYIMHGISAQNTVRITPQNFGPSGNYVWTSSNTYVLEGDLRLESGYLVIQPGTQIRISQNDIQSTGLTIGQGASILANGTPTGPIHFSPENNGGLSDLFIDNNWKGLHVKQDSESSLSRLTYVSISHAGAPIQSQTGAALFLEDLHNRNEIEYVEVFGSIGDGVRIWGGEVNLKYISSTFVQDDAFEWDYGWIGNGLYWFAYGYGIFFSPNSSTDKAHLIEGHGNTSSNNRISSPRIFHSTFLGGSCNLVANAPYNNMGSAIYFADNTKGLLANSIIADVAQKGVAVEDNLGEEDAKNQMTEGRLNIKNNLWSRININTFSFDFDEWSTNYSSNEDGIIMTVGGGEDEIGLFLTQHLIQNSNIIVDNILYANRQSQIFECLAIDPRFRKKISGKQLENFSSPSIAFFQELTNTTSKGSFNQNNKLWLDSWSDLSEKSTLGKNARIGLFYKDTIVIQPNQTIRINCDDYPVRLQLYSGSCGSLKIERCFEDYLVGQDLSLEFLDPNKTYFLRIQDKANYFNYFDLALLDFNPLNDLPTYCNRANPLIFNNLNSCLARTI
jgi:hypothetical protein